MSMIINVAFSYLLLTIAFTVVSSWTIDLPEVRKYHFSRNNGDNVINVDGRQTYDNIHGNSLHNTDHHQYERYVNDNKQSNENRHVYADDFKYEGYMEKQVHEVVGKGSAYLDGLRRSLEQYMELLENCSRSNFTDELTTPPPMEQPSTPPPMEQPSTPPVGNFSELLSNFTGSRNWTIRCRNATKYSEHVRRMADLALWATRRLEDIAYAARFHKDHDKEENELLLRLSYYLEQVARYTGYQPDVHNFVTEPTTRAPTTAPALALPFDSVPRDIVNNTMTCLDLKNKSASSQPATERCMFPLPLPDIVQQMINGGPSSAAPTSQLQESLPDDNSDSSQAPSSMELMITADTGNDKTRPLTPVTLPNDLTVVKSVHKRSIDESENPLIKIMKYYAKHKVWLNSNPEIEMKNTENFDVSNRLHRRKRTIFKKNIHLRLPENPFRALKDHIKHKAGVHYVNNKIQADLFKETLNKMRHSTSLTVKHNLQKVFKKVAKRSVHYRKPHMPRVSQNPYKDISYYSKSKPGTNYNSDPVQAAQVRLGLEQVFQTGNIEVVRRYGSNYNPLNPNPLFTGILLSMSDV